MQVWINGEQRELESGRSVGDVLAEMGLPEKGIAVAVDGAVVPRASWPEAVLGDGARVEVLTAVQGG